MSFYHQKDRGGRWPFPGARRQGSLSRTRQLVGEILPVISDFVREQGNSPTSEGQALALAEQLASQLTHQVRMHTTYNPTARHQDIIAAIEIAENSAEDIVEHALKRPSGAS